MILTVQQVLTHIYITVRTQRKSVLQDLVPAPERLGSLLDKTSQGIEDMCALYSKLPLVGVFRLNRVIVKRLVELMNWIKYKDRIN